MKSTTAMRFVDTNVLLYTLSKRAGEEDKRAAAIRIVNESDLALSVQVLQEFFTQATRKTFVGRLSDEDAVAYIESYKRFPIQETTVDLMDAALRSKARYQISYWDAAIVEAARALGCDEILTEDLIDGQDFGGVRVRNPFREN